MMAGTERLEKNALRAVGMEVGQNTAGMRVSLSGAVEDSTSLCRAATLFFLIIAPHREFLPIKGFHAKESGLVRYGAGLIENLVECDRQRWLCRPKAITVVFRL